MVVLDVVVSDVVVTAIVSSMSLRSCQSLSSLISLITPQTGAFALVDLAGLVTSRHEN